MALTGTHAISDTGHTADHNLIDKLLAKAVQGNITLTSIDVDVTGTTDATATIQAAINALPATGGTVFLPAGLLKVTSTLTMGNGTTTTVSTTSGFKLKGAGVSGSAWAGLNAAGTTLKFANATAGTTVISVKGPVSGWSIEDLLIDGGTSATPTALNVISGQWGGCTRVHVINCKQGFVSVVVGPSFSGHNTNTMHNVYESCSVFIPDIAGAAGLVLYGNGAANNVCYDLHRGLSIAFTPPAGANTSIGIYIADCDSTTFRDLHMTNTGVQRTAVTFAYDSGNATHPADVMFDHCDFGGGALAISGTPAGATKNRIVGVGSTNGAPTNTGIANLAYGYTAANP